MDKTVTIKANTGNQPFQMNLNNGMINLTAPTQQVPSVSINGTTGEVTIKSLQCPQLEAIKAQLDILHSIIQGY